MSVNSFYLLHDSLVLMALLLLVLYMYFNDSSYIIFLP